ncbi:heavy metal-associated isoprenylated plant protein 43-like isoform X2 [Mangifera indica]|nr:heavy metal-associated isoprenylated plant protein 43-like isoform X2 [Mangifera indica]
MVQRTVLKVIISCKKCKRELLKAVAALQGLDKIEVDEAKGTLTVTGSADPYDIITRTKKTGKFVDVVSIGPPPAPPKQPGKKTDEKKPEEKKNPEKAEDKGPVVHYPPYYICPLWEGMAVVHVDPYPEPTFGCSIL